MLHNPESPAAHVSLFIRALGRFQVTVKGVTIPEGAWGTRKAMMVLAWLAEARERGVSADVLEGGLWPDAPVGARQALHTAVSRIRRAFRQVPDGEALPAPLLLERSAYRLNPGYVLHFDVATFEEHCASALRMADEGNAEAAARESELALGLYQGPYIEGPADDWLEGRRRTLEGRRYEIVDRLAGLRAEAGRIQESIELFQANLARSPCRESSQVGLMGVLLAAGRKEEAIHHYHASVRSLRRIRNLPPSEGLVALYEAALRA